MIEAYVSFEVAKLLKEKGFDEICSYEWGVPEIDGGYVLQKWNLYNGQITNSELIDDAYSAPTHQMAMAWLREKGVYMSIDTVISSAGNIYYNIDTYTEKSGWNHPVDFYDSYEESIEAALKYSLENLI